MNADQLQNDDLRFWHYSEDDHLLWSELSAECYERLLQSADPKCLEGINFFGLLGKKIPSIDQLDSKLREIGWTAAPVDGLIAPNLFFRYLSNKTLPIAVQMRSRQFKYYSPSPDIFHEVFGHACLLIDSGYATSLQKFGEISLQAFSLPGDCEYNNELTKLSRDKAYDSQPSSAPIHSLGAVSEATALARLGWWTFECGLIKYRAGSRVYGAALLSSIQEMTNAKAPKFNHKLDKECILRAYDPTSLQTDYYLTQNFEQIELILSEVAAEMAFTIGGARALSIAMHSQQKSVIHTRDIEITGLIDSFSLADGCRIKLKGPYSVYDVRKNRTSIFTPETVVTLGSATDITKTSPLQVNCEAQWT